MVFQGRVKVGYRGSPDMRVWIQQENKRLKITQGNRRQSKKLEHWELKRKTKQANQKLSGDPKSLGAVID